MNITKFILIFLPLILLKYVTRKDLISYDNYLLNTNIKGLLKRILLVKYGEKSANKETDIDDEKEYKEYLENKGSNEFDKVKYKYMDNVNFTILKSRKTYKHILNEFLVFLGSQYSTDEKIVVRVKLIDILSLLFVHYRDTLSNFDHIVNSFQDRNKLMNSIENEFFREFLDERDNYILEVKNMYYEVDYKDKEKEKILNKKKTIYDIFLQNWKNDGYRFYSINNKRKYYVPKKLYHNKGKTYLHKIEEDHNFKCRNLVFPPSRNDENSSNAQNPNNQEKSASPTYISMHAEDNEVEETDQESEEQMKLLHFEDKNKKKKEGSSSSKDNILPDNSSEDGFEEFYDKQICHASENENVGTGNDNAVRNLLPGTSYKMKKEFFLSGVSFNVISLINAITSNKDNKVVAKLHDGLRKLGITTFDHLVRYTNIIGIFFSYDIFDELYLQIKLVKEYFGLNKKKKNEFGLIEKVEKKQKRIIYGEYKMNEDEMFTPPNCLTAYCKLKSVWIQNRNFTFNIERTGTNSMNFMMLGDIGQGFEDAKEFDVQNMLNFMGYNELKSTVDTMKKWHLENNADFVINLGDNVPNEGAINYIENFQWYNLMKEFFVFKKRSEKEINTMLGKNPITKQNIDDFYNEKIKEIKDVRLYGKTKKNKKDSENSNADDDLSYYDNNRKELYQFDDDEKEQEEDYTESIPFYSILGEKDYFNFPSEQIQEHYSKRIPGYFMPNNYYCVNYDFSYSKRGMDNEIIDQEKFRASFIFIDTWSLMVGFPIIRNYRSFREQFNWLSKTLYESAQNSDWIFVFGHHPLISSGRRADNYSYEEHSFHDILRDFLFNYNVDAYFSAHDHLMEHIKFGNIDLFVNGSSSRVLFDNCNMGRGYFGKVIGTLYPVTCYVLKTIHRGLKPKGCNVNRYSKWSNKRDIGFSIHKLTKDEFITQFINSRNGKPLSDKIIIKNKKHERKKFYDLDGYAADRIKELEKKLEEFRAQNPDLIKFKIEEFNENTNKLNSIMKTLKTKEEQDAFKELLFLNNLIFDVSKFLDKITIVKLKVMRELAEKYRIFFNKELVNNIVVAIEKAVKEENNQMNEHLGKEGDENEDPEITKERRAQVENEKKTLELIETLGYSPEQFLDKIDYMTKKEKDMLQEKIGKNVSLEDYVNRIRMYVNKKKLSPDQLEELALMEEEKESADAQEEKEEQNENNPKQDFEQSDEENKGQNNKAMSEIPLEKDVHKNNKYLVIRESKLTEPNYVLLMLCSLKSYDESKYALNLESKKEQIKTISSANYIYTIDNHKTFFQLCIELAPDIKRIISNLGGVGLRLPFFKLINKLYDEIMKLKFGLDRIST
ncbi:serine/threonine protein phosphatase UIS2 [Plasmodium brasilianum]|uniref:Ser/Thr protein phosphatase family protein n=2 Tax=Plasmodium (Plasmodium) TaxID=418103 RepID=A0A1A8W9N4_PLAMA|nr:serine/threonine protein phosphatase UIS2, putative [Plasmodium malariae]KAI4836646.1 serine/threonine protein phosphatase UIS2 [Plasmodium brasilianum]SBS88418.1 Ser/Thr protein phosphatase family protein [Plasmodium malariae]SCO93926.1 serine/threonine protein phosphatase UIS2, putative [Plasmodium malariae]